MAETKKDSALDLLLRPRSIALVGASATPGSFGASVLANLDAALYPGDIYLINPKRATIGERPCLSSVDALPRGVDCAVLTIPRSDVLTTVRGCAQRGVGSVIVFSAGFAEAGEEGRAEQRAMAEIARETGMVIEGPNCLGMVNYLERIPLTFVNTPVERPDADGTRWVAIVSQSGAMAAVLSVNMRLHSLPMTFSVSTGNEAATGVEDFLEYMIGQRDTHVIAMIVEQFREPKRLLELAARARAVGKFIVLLHPGSTSGARASAATHTGAMAGNYEVMKTKVRRAGVLQVETLEEVADVVDLLCRCPSLPLGGAAVFTESGAFKALTLDFCEKHGLPLPPLREETETALRVELPVFILPSNPLDITAQGLVDPELYKRTLPPILADSTYGSVVLGIILTDAQTSGLKLPPLLAAIESLRPQKPVLFAAMDEGGFVDPAYIARLHAAGVPFFPSPERALRALAGLTRFAEELSNGAEVAASSSPSSPLPAGTLPEYRSKDILRANGIAIAQGRLASSVEEAVYAAASIGYPVVLKAQAGALPHKSDAGGVQLNLRDEQQVREAWDTMHSDLARACPGLLLEGVLVEAMARSGLELIVGAQRDPDWGPILLVGFGGVHAEVLKDVRLLTPEMREPEILREMRALRGAKLFDGFRGSPPADVAAAASAVAALGAFVLAHPEVREVDLNPLVVYPAGQGALALDALIVVGPTP